MCIFPLAHFYLTYPHFFSGIQPSSDSAVLSLLRCSPALVSDLKREQARTGSLVLHSVSQLHNVTCWSLHALHIPLKEHRLLKDMFSCAEKVRIMHLSVAAVDNSESFIDAFSALLEACGDVMEELVWNSPLVDIFPSLRDKPKLHRFHLEIVGCNIKRPFPLQALDEPVTWRFLVWISLSCRSLTKTTDVLAILAGDETPNLTHVSTTGGAVFVGGEAFFTKNQQISYVAFRELKGRKPPLVPMANMTRLSLDISSISALPSCSRPALSHLFLSSDKRLDCRVLASRYWEALKVVVDARDRQLLSSLQCIVLEQISNSSFRHSPCSAAWRDAMHTFLDLAHANGLLLLDSTGEPLGEGYAMIDVVHSDGRYA